MAYDKYTWQTGEVITQEKLNHMEDGIENAYELPSVTETDNGKVLGVEDGQFGLVSGETPIRVVAETQVGSEYRLDIGGKELYDALCGGTVVFTYMVQSVGSPAHDQVSWSMISWGAIEEFNGQQAYAFMVGSLSYSTVDYKIYRAPLATPNANPTFYDYD